MSDAALLRVEGVHSYYGTSHILHGVSIALNRGVVALVGRNGMGKTTLVKTIMGIVPARAGTIALKGEPITHLKPYQIASRGVGYVPQGRDLFQSLTVDEHFMLASRGDSTGSWTAERVYDLFPRLRERARQRAASLSGGEQQMLAIGRALVTNPELLIMDEPSEGLAPVILDNLIETYKSLANMGMSMFIVEQNVRTATSLTEELHIMVKGSIAAKVNAQTLLHDQELREKHLGVKVQET